jgi:hypothetical protein
VNKYFHPNEKGMKIIRFGFRFNCAILFLVTGTFAGLKNIPPERFLVVESMLVIVGFLAALYIEWLEGRVQP